MKTKILFCLLLCFSVILSAVSCRKADNAFSSNIDVSSQPDIYQDVELIEDEDVPKENTDINSSLLNESSSSQNDTSSTPETQTSSKEESSTPSKTSTPSSKVEKPVSSKPTQSSKKETSTTTSDTKKPTASSKDENTSTSSSDETTSTDKDVITMLYGFKSIKKVDYHCVKNLPDSDVIYSVSGITTNADTDICDSSTVILCDDKNIEIEDKVITIPLSYIKSNKSVKLTAYHSGTGAKYDFTIKHNEKWDIVFEDNFDGTKLNTDIWNVWDSADWQYFYSPDSVFLDGKGNLINRMAILDTPHPEYGYNRQTGAITTLDKFETTYGYFEIRMIPNMTSGLWSAFWLMSGDMGDVDAADDGTAVNGCEIDIVETYYYRNDPAQTIHWDGYYKNAQGEKQTKSEHFSMIGVSDVFDGNYHTFSLRWSPQEYVFLIDGKVTAKTKKMGISNKPGYLLVSAHYGNAGELVLKPGEYSDMIVDYVKVYSSSED